MISEKVLSIVEINEHSFYSKPDELTVNCDVKGQGEGELFYSFKIRKNGCIIGGNGFEKKSSYIFKLTEPGCYRVQYRLKDNSNKFVYKDGNILWLLPLCYDWNGSVSLQKWLLSLPPENGYCGQYINLSDQEISEIRDTKVLVLDFIQRAQSFVNNYSDELKFFRASDEPNLSNENIQYFRENVGKELSQAIQIYGEDNVFVFAPLYRFENTNEYQKNLNYVLEEAYDVVRRTKGVELLLFPDSTEDEIGIYPSKKDTDNCLKQIKKFAQNKFVGEIQVPQIDVRLGENIFYVTVTNDLPKGTFYGRIDLMRDGKVIDQIKSFECGITYSWTLEQSGIYVAQAHFSRFDAESSYGQSKAVFYETEEQHKEYLSFLKSKTKKPQIGNKLYYATPIQPVCDWLVVSEYERGNAQKIYNGVQVLNKDYRKFSLPTINGWSTSVITDDSVKQIADGNVILSGNLIIDCKRYEGTKNIPNDVKSMQLDGAYGNYSAVFWNNETVSVFSDLLRYGPIFVYEKDNLIIICNNYSMLLKAVCEIDHAARLDIDKAIINISTCGFQMLMQSISYDMDVEGIKRVAYHYNPRLDNMGWQNCQSKTGRLLIQKEPYHEERYRRLLYSVLNEVESVTSSYFDKSLDDKPVLLLTGGQDSRFIYSIITKLKDKVLPNIACWDLKTDEGKLDWQIGTSLCGLLQYPYDIIPTTKRMCSLIEEDARNRSICIGQYYSWKTSGQISIIEEKNITTLYGSGGEILLRPYISNRYYNAPKDAQTSIYGLVEYIRSRMMQNVLVQSEKGFEQFSEYFGRALGSLPKLSPLESVNRHYMDLRHGVHFAVIWTSKNGHPIQSETLLRLSHLTYDIFLSDKLNYDLLYLSNSDIAQFPYSHENYNLAREILKDKLVIRDQKIQPVDITLGRDEARWRESVKIKQKNASVKNQLPKGSQVNKNNIPNILRQSSISLLHELLLEEDNIERRIGSALYYSLKNRILSDYEQQMVYDKLVSVLDQVKYLRGDIPIVVEPDGKMYRAKLKISDKLFRMFNKWGQLLKQ